MNSNTAMIPTMMFSILNRPSKFLAKAGVQTAYRKEQNHDPDIDQIHHSGPSTLASLMEPLCHLVGALVNQKAGRSC
jgi:hypothetical protein